MTPSGDDRRRGAGVAPRTRLVESPVSGVGASVAPPSGLVENGRSTTGAVVAPRTSVDENEVLAADAAVAPRRGLVERVSTAPISGVVEPRTGLVESLTPRSGATVAPQTRLVEEESRCGVWGTESDRAANRENPGTGAGSDTKSVPTTQHPSFNRVLCWCHTGTTNNNTLTQTAKRGANVAPQTALVESGGGGS